MNLDYIFLPIIIVFLIFLLIGLIKNKMHRKNENYKYSHYKFYGAIQTIKITSGILSGIILIFFYVIYLLVLREEFGKVEAYENNFQLLEFKYQTTIEENPFGGSIFKDPEYNKYIKYKNIDFFDESSRFLELGDTIYAYTQNYESFSKNSIIYSKSLFNLAQKDIYSPRRYVIKSQEKIINK